MKFIIPILIAPFIFGCALNVYHESIEVKPKIFEVLDLKLKDKLYLDLKERSSDQIYESFEIPVKCQELVQIGDVLVLDSVITVRNGVTTYEVIDSSNISSVCFGKDNKKELNE